MIKNVRSAAPAGGSKPIETRHASLLTAVVWMLIVLMILPKDFVSLFSETPSPGASQLGSSVNSIGWLIILVSAVALVGGRVSVALDVFKDLNRGFVLFMLLAIISVAWSADSGVTIERVRRMLIFSFSALAFVSYAWYPRRFQDAARPIILFLLAGSIIYGLMFPELAIHQSDQAELKNSWHGLTFQKNILGALGTYGVILCFHGWLTRELKLLPALIGFVISITCVLLSRSSTSLLTSAFTMFFLFLALRLPPSMKRYMPYIVIFFVLVTAAYALVALGLLPLQGLLNPISAVTGKDAASATGRAPIWALVKAEITRHPWLGIGYGAYWVGPIPGTASYIFVTAIFFYAGTAHNGYLDITNDLGYAGPRHAVVVHRLVRPDSMKLWKIDRSQAALYLALLFQQGLENLSESEWLQAQSFNCVVMTLATFAMARALRDARRARSPSAAASSGARQSQPGLGRFAR
ncbi:MAG: O-antigen ligase family protein [Gammaproteobacteria bacterium]